jgi:zinc transport system ATP-binding protein
MAVIDFAQVDFGYDADLILRAVSFTVAAGDFTAIVGPNGAGKTTLFKLILGEITPQAGTITVLDAPAGERRQAIGYVPQHGKFDPAFPVSVLDVVLMGRLGKRFFGWATAADRAVAHATLARLALTAYASTPFHQLSGGQKQRTLIARALATDAKLLLLDEPTANVDRKTETAFYELLSELNSTHTILTISHNLELVSQAVKQVICVNRGVSMHQTTALDEARLREVFGTDLRLVKHNPTCEHCAVLAAPSGE